MSNIDLRQGDCLELMKDIPDGSVDAIITDPPLEHQQVKWYTLPMKRVFTEQHRENISKACKGRKTWSKGKKMPQASLYKNMASHIRFDVSAEWLSQFEDIEKLKFLNRCISKRTERFDVDTDWYIAYINRFYSDEQFNKLYDKWLGTGDAYLRPTIDHINPKANGGNNTLDNLQFLSWFENRAKNDMPQVEWQRIKNNIKDYLL